MPYPTQEQLDACDLVVWPDGTRSPEYYLGGHVYQVTDAVAAALAAAGYSDPSGEGDTGLGSYADDYVDVYA